MKPKLIVLLVVMAAVLGFAQSGVAGKVLYEDKFTSMDPGWGAAPDEFFNIKDGKLTLQPAVNQVYTILYEGNIFPNDLDVTINMEFTKVDAPTWGSGLVFWSGGLKNYYALLINPEGWFTVQRRMGERFINPLRWSASEALQKGAGVSNKLRVVTKGNKATIYLNDKEVGSFTGTPPEGGSQIGVRAASGVEAQNAVVYTNLKVTEP